MTEQGFNRKLTAILCADVKGYSILMADDEVATMQTLKEYLKNMSVYIEQHGGRVVDAVGDNLLAEFGSAVDAVQCAVEVQKELKAKNQELPEDKKLEFRIGINIGDVIQDGDRIFGDGLNVAARIEGIADPGGVCISRNTYEHVRDKLEFGFEFLGEHEVKNIREPVRVYKVVLDSEPLKPLVKEPHELPDKPSIAVLPFVNMSGDPSQQYFSDGLTEQIISGLCKARNLFVIARNSSFAYRDKSVSIKQIAQELGVKYILEGSVQRAGDRVRITAQLIDAATDYHMWSETYDREISDIFALQDEITLKLIAIMQIKLTLGEQARLWARGTNNIQALEKIERGMEFVNRSNKQNIAQARHIFEQAANLDENSAAAVTMIGWTHFLDFAWNWSDSPLESFVEAEQYAHRAIAMDDSLDGPHTLLAWIHFAKGEYDKAIYEGNQAVVLNPNGADAIAHLGAITCLAGEPEKGLILIKKAMKLNPIPQSWYYHFLGDAYRMTGQYEEAVEIVNHSIMIESEVLLPYLTLTVCYVELNDFDKAQISAKKVLEIDPNFSVERFKSVPRYRDQTELEKIAKSLRKAGLPE